MSVEGCGEPNGLVFKEGGRGGTMGSPAQETGGSPRSQKEGGYGENMVSVHSFAGDREPKASGGHAGDSDGTWPWSSASVDVE